MLSDSYVETYSSTTCWSFLSSIYCRCLPSLADRSTDSNRVRISWIEIYFQLCVLLIIHFFSLYYSADTAASFLLALCTINTMWPITVCSAKVLLNTTPPYVLGQLDKLLSETQTLGNAKFYNLFVLYLFRFKSKPDLFQICLKQCSSNFFSLLNP